MELCIHNMLSDGNQTDGNTLERFQTPYQNSRLSLSLTPIPWSLPQPPVACLCGTAGTLSAGLIGHGVGYGVVPCWNNPMLPQNYPALYKDIFW